MTRTSIQTPIPRQRIFSSPVALAFVRTVVQRHGGAIEVESALGEGTTFSMRLPIVIEG